MQKISRTRETENKFSFLSLALSLHVLNVYEYKMIVGEADFANIPLLTVTTEGGEFPSCTVVYPPEGCIGTGITDNENIPGRLVMTLGGKVVYDSGDYVKGESGVRGKIRGNSSGAVEGQKP